MKEYKTTTKKIYMSNKYIPTPQEIAAAKIPGSFKPGIFEEIPHPRDHMFPQEEFGLEKHWELAEKVGRHLIQQDLTKRLGKTVLSKHLLGTPAYLKAHGVKLEDFTTDKVVAR